MARDVEALILVNAGSLRDSTLKPAGVEVQDASGLAIVAIDDFLHHMIGRGDTRSSCRAYASQLLRWWRFLATINVDWERATREDFIDHVVWMRCVTPKRGSRVNGRRGYKPRTINLACAAISEFYSFHVRRGRGPLVNPARDDERRRPGRLKAVTRLLLSCTAHAPVTGRTVVDTFLTTIDEYGPPASTLTDNGRVYTARHGGGRNEFEYVIAALGIRQKNGAPGHPQTQGKIERFHQTLKRWLTARPRAHTIAELQTQLDTFREHYNIARPHRARNGATPATAYLATPKALPTGHSNSNHYRVRHDHVAIDGKISLRRAGRMHHLGVGTAHRGKRVLILIDNTTVTIVHTDTGEIIATNQINPDKTYWRNTQKEPGRWPGSPT